MVVLATAQATSAGDDNLGRTEFRTFGLGQFPVGELGLIGVGSGADGFDFGTVATVDRIEGSAAHGDDLDRVGALDRGQGIAGVDRTNEGVRRFDGGDFGDLGDVEQGGDSWAEVLAEGGGWRKDMAVPGGVGEDQGGEVFGGLVLVVDGVGHFHLGDALQLGGGLSGAVAA